MQKYARIQQNGRTGGMEGVRVEFQNAGPMVDRTYCGALCKIALRPKTNTGEIFGTKLILPPPTRENTIKQVKDETEQIAIQRKHYIPTDG